MDTNNRNDKKIGGLRAKSLAIAIIAVLLALNLLIAGLFIGISRESRNLSAIMQRNGEYNNDVAGFISGWSKLSELATSYVLSPVTGNNETNYGPLLTYAGELKSTDNRGPQVVERFNSYDVSDEARAYLAEASDASQGMLESQLHALALMNAVYDFTGTPALGSLPLPELTAAEKAYPNERKEGMAKQLLLGTEYALNKQTVSLDVAACQALIKSESAQKIADTNAKISSLRNGLWLCTVAMLFVLATIYMLVKFQIIKPIRKLTQAIRDGKSPAGIKGLHEVRELTAEYGGLLRRRDALDSILRSSAETDTLTGLPNRYAFQQYLLGADEQNGDTMGLVMFDVNFLKRTNDTLGHSAGDKLLQDASECILSCFGSSEESNCFRLGGDEFAAVLKETDNAAISHKVNLFVLEQQRRQISVSWGYALAAELENPTPKDLVDTADKRMYEQKKQMHDDEVDKA